MLPSPQFTPEEQYKYDESLKERQKDDWVRLPDETDDVFIEEQNLDQGWIWLLMGIVTLGVFVSLLMAGQWGSIMFVVGAILVASMSIMSLFRLNTKIDREGVHYHVNPFPMKYKTVRWEEIDQIYVRRYSPLLEYGGWGIRYGRKGWAYTARGNEGIQMVLKNGKRILIGTQLGEDAASMISHRSITV